MNNLRGVLGQTTAGLVGDGMTFLNRCVDDEAHEVESVTADSGTVAGLTLKESEIRSLASREILHVRELASA